MKKVFFMCLTVLVLCACVDKTISENSSKGTGEADVENEQFEVEEKLLNSGTRIYKKSAIDLPNNDSFVLSAVKADAGDLLYFYAVDESRTNLFYAYDMTNHSCTQLDIDIPGKVDSLDAANNSLYILINENDVEENGRYEFMKYDCTTRELTSILFDNTAAVSDELRIAGFSVVADQLYVNALEEMYCLDAAGKITDGVQMENVWQGLSRWTDGLMLYRNFDSRFVVQMMDYHLRLTRNYCSDTTYSDAFPGFSDHEIFVADDTCIYTLDLDTGDKKAFVNILLNNLYVSSFIPLSEESFFTIQNGAPTLWTASAEDTEQNVILKCATYNASNELQSTVSFFNYHHDNIKIDLMDYSVYDDGLTKLTTEIAAGKMPDLIDLSAVPLTNLQSLGLLQNIQAYLSGKDLVPNLFETLKRDGGIYEFVPGFQVVTMASSHQYIPSASLTAEELLSLAETARSQDKYLLPQYISREEFLSYLLAFSGGSFIDIDKNYCNFENEAFANLVQFAADLPSQNDLSGKALGDAFKGELTAILDGKQLISIVETADPVGELLSLEGLFADDIEFIGFPADDGNGIAMTPSVRIGMSSVSAFQQEIWSFFDFLLSEEFQSKFSGLGSMPVVQPYLSDYIDSMIKRYQDTPLQIVLDVLSDTTLDCPPVDDETADDVWNLIHRIDCVNEFDSTIYDIVLEECQRFWAGDKDILETLSMIQSRASLYVHEMQ